MSSRWIGIGLALAGIVVPALVSRADEGRSSAAWTRNAARTEIRLAVSSDGLAFREVDGVVLRGAAAPSMTRRSGGDLLAVFDYAGEGSAQDVTVPAVSRSTDLGRSWSALEPVLFAGGHDPLVKPRHMELIRGGKGFVRMLFAHDRPAKPGSKGEAMPTVAAASSRDGLHFRVDNPSCIPPMQAADLYPTVAESNRDMWLWVEARAGRRKTKKRKSNPSLFRRAEGSTFKPVGDRVTIGGHFPGCVLALEGGLRAYVSAPEGVVSFVSKNGRRWLKEDGVRLKGGWDPAVVPLRDGSLLMLYCAPLRPKGQGEKELVMVDRSAFHRAVMAAGSMSRDAEKAEGAASDESEPIVVAGGADDAWAQGASDAFAANGDDTEPSAQADGALGTTRAAIAEPVSFDADGFAPVPDFVHHIDYAAHYRALRNAGPDDAYPYYARLMMDPTDEFSVRPDWPVFNDMFNGGEHQGPPAPWSDAEHPEWAATSDEAADLLAGFRDAARHEGYATPLRFAGDDPLKTADGKPLLFEMMLPSLSTHRSLAKATLADAWRIGEDGRVDPDRMRDAIETTLRDAGHMAEGATIIEHLVGVAEGALTQETARQALHQGVFSTEEEIAATLDVLMQYDRDDRDPTLSMRGEHMSDMDAIQALFSRKNSEGEPTLDMKLAKEIGGMIGEDEPDDALAQMTAEDAVESARVFDEHFHRIAEMWRTGYPEVRAADMEEVEERDVSATPLTKVLMPALSRYYKLTTREETSRRATQLAYATELFHKQNGRWPASLDELPAGYGERMRIDPFTGEHFGYRVDESGPRIYSRSENGVDDGGVHSPRWDDQPVDGSDDHVFWPPQPR